MNKQLTRREFLKLSAVVGGAILLPRLPASSRQFRRRKTMLSRVMLPGADAVGNDGSQAWIYALAPAPGAPRRWRVHLQGGGLCYDASSCQLRQADVPAMMTYDGFPDSLVGTGILSSDSAVTPWSDYGAVFVHYGSSDFFDGAGDNGGWRFRGRAIVQAAMNYIKQQGGGIVRELILSGISAGGVGVLASIDWISAMFPQARVLGLCDAGWILDRQPFDSALASPRTQAEAGAAYWQTGNTGAKYLESGFGGIAKRADVFVQQSQFDVDQLEALGVLGTTPDELAYRAQFGENVIASLSMRGVTGYYCPATDTHGLVLNDWNTNLVGSLSLCEVFQRWYWGLPACRKVGA